MEKTLPVSVLNQYPPAGEAAVSALLQAELARNDTKFIVLDDDPTGVQTVHDVSVYTDWSVESISQGLLEDTRLFYILTNSRALTPAQTEALHREIAANAAEASKRTGKKFLFISRSDSTLRGHYPLETQVLRDCLESAGQPVDGEILFPYFKEGGRFTLHHTHYVQYGVQLVPAAQTEFAKDASFGYTHSDLTQYIAEKTHGAYRAEDVTTISIEELRAQDYDAIVSKLMQVTGFGKVTVDALDDCDVKIFAVALYRAMARGKTFLFRTAASFVKAAGGISTIPYLQRKDMQPERDGRGGLVIVGSHTEKTTAQLHALLQLPETEPIAFDSDLVLQGEFALAQEVERCVALEEKAILEGKVAVCYTKRTLLHFDADTEESALRRSVRISESVQALAGQLRVKPAFLIAKGGITSSIIGTQALRVRRALVLGQILPGIPVWRTGAESKFPGMAYVIFPGNVGDTDSLRRAVEILTK